MLLVNNSRVAKDNIAIRSFKTTETLHPLTQHNITEDWNLHNRIFWRNVPSPSKNI